MGGATDPPAERTTCCQVKSSGIQTEQNHSIYSVMPANIRGQVY